jgi:aerobic C4-dicarboxylate transport protein
MQPQRAATRGAGWRVPMHEKTPFYRTLYAQVLLAIALGAALGCLYPEGAAQLKPLSEGFIRLIKMLIAPLIFTTVVVGIAGAEDLKKVGRTGGLALLYFEVGSTIALALGLVIVNLIRPGAGMNVDARSLNANAIAGATQAKPPGTLEFLLNIIPHSVVEAFARGDTLQVLLFAVLFGFALQRVGARNNVVFTFIERFSHVLFAIVGMVMKLAPLGAFAAMAFTVGSYGVSTLLSLAKLMAAFYATCIVFVFGALGLVARVHGFSLLRLVVYLREELMIVLGTSSSESVVPRMLVKLEKLGASKTVVGLVLPTGYSFNLDGTSIYLTMAAIFVAQATNTHLDWLQQISLLGVLMLASKGAAGVTGSGFVVLAATLASVGGIPVAGLALLLGVDRFMSEARALTNLVGNAVATLVVAKWSGELDSVQLRGELALPSNEAVVQTTQGAPVLVEPA